MTATIARRVARLWTRRLALLVCAYFTGCLTLLGCQDPFSPPTTQQDLCGFAWSPELRLGGTDAEGVSSWIVANYGEISGATSSTRGQDHLFFTGWTKDKTLGHVVVRNDRLARISIEGVEQGPTLGQVVAGLGPPEAVHARITWLTCERVCPYMLELDYPALGVSVAVLATEDARKAQDQTGFALALKETLKVNWIDCYIPGSMEAVLRDAFQYSDENLPSQLQRRQPWPGFGVRVPLKP